VLLGSTNDRLIQGITTTLVAHSVLAELSTVYCVTSYEVRADWPRHVLVARSVFTADPLMQDHVANEGKASGAEKKKEHTQIASTHALRGNLCDRVHQLSPLAAHPDLHLHRNLFVCSKLLNWKNSFIRMPQPAGCVDTGVV
jgi:hypothetical protein